MEKIIIPSLLVPGNSVFLAENMLRITTPFLDSDPKLQLLHTSLTGIYNRMVENMNNPRKSAFTQTKLEADKQRDRAFLCLRDMLHGASLSLLADMAGQAAPLYAVLENLGLSLYKDGYKKETAILASLFAEFDKDEHQARLTTLGLLPYYTSLKDAETAFKEVSKQRVEEKTTRAAESEPLTEILDEMLPAMTNMEGYMQLYSQLDPDTYANAYNEMVTVISEVNASARALRTIKENDVVKEA